MPLATFTPAMKRRARRAPTRRAVRNRPSITPRQRAVYHIIKRHGPMTDTTLVAHYPVLRLYLDRPYPEQSPSGLRTRRSELEAKGYVQDSGTKQRTASGKSAILWEAI